MGKAWKIIPRPLLETILNNHAQHHRVHQPLIVHGPRGVGKTTLFRCRLLDDWNKPPHLTGYVDFGLPSQDQQPQDHHIPWSSLCTIPSGGPAPSLLSLCAQLERCLESMVHAGVRLGSIGSHQVFFTLNKWHGIDTALRRIIRSRGGKDGSGPTSVLWSRAIFALGADSHTCDTSNVLVGLEGKVATREEEAYYREAALSLRLAKEVIGIHQAWRANAVAHLNRTGGFSRSLANSATDWPCLLVELLSDAAELDFFQIICLKPVCPSRCRRKPNDALQKIPDRSSQINAQLVSTEDEQCYTSNRVISVEVNGKRDTIDHFSQLIDNLYQQFTLAWLEPAPLRLPGLWVVLPKLVINNIDVLRRAIQSDDSTVSAAMYHDSLLWRLIALGVNEKCLPVILVTSDSYYSYRAFMDFGFPDIFISRETFGWSPPEAKMHMVTEFFSELEWKVIADVLGTSPRHLSELYGLKHSRYYQKIMEDGRGNTFEDIVNAYIAYLQVTVVNPAMESVLDILQKFAFDALNGRISKDRLRFGAPWRHPPRTDNPNQRLKWAKLQLMDFIQSLVNAEFGVNYLADSSLEILDDPSTAAMLEVGLLYAQRDPSFIRPITRGIERCLVRWLVQQRMQLSFQESLQFLLQRIIRGRSYRHLMKEAGYK